jgi:hypothetical protein
MYIYPIIGASSQLDPQTRDTLIECLHDNPLSREPDPRLEYAAELGVTGGANRRRGTKRRQPASTQEHDTMDCQILFPIVRLADSRH